MEYWFRMSCATVATDFVNLVEAFGKESDSACSFR